MSDFAKFCPNCRAFFRDPILYQQHIEKCGRVQEKDDEDVPVQQEENELPPAEEPEGEQFVTEPPVEKPESEQPEEPVKQTTTAKKQSSKSKT